MLPTRIHAPIPPPIHRPPLRKPVHPPPLKHLRYHGQVAMTVCIAAVCHRGDPCIVLCSDSRLDHGYLGSTNYASKFRIIGKNWCVLMAGIWEPTCELVNMMRSTFGDATFTTRGEVLLTVR